eukprot:m.235715 g.235715  ORF g.235715 m.235715 type:complete len:307 (+) comp22484_c4_seq5:1319-2239(+)
MQVFTALLLLCVSAVCAGKAVAPADWAKEFQDALDQTTKTGTNHWKKLFAENVEVVLGGTTWHDLETFSKDWEAAYMGQQILTTFNPKAILTKNTVTFGASTVGNFHGFSTQSPWGFHVRLNDQGKGAFVHCAMDDFTMMKNAGLPTAKPTLAGSTFMSRCSAKEFLEKFGELMELAVNTDRGTSEHDSAVSQFRNMFAPSAVLEMQDDSYALDQAVKKIEQDWTDGTKEWHLGMQSSVVEQVYHSDSGVVFVTTAWGIDANDNTVVIPWAGQYRFDDNGKIVHWGHYWSEALVHKFGTGPAKSEL